jgi:hypothetical protein
VVNTRDGILLLNLTLLKMGFWPFLIDPILSTLRSHHPLQLRKRKQLKSISCGEKRDGNDLFLPFPLLLPLVSIST